MEARGAAMRCRDVQELLSAHLDGELEGARAAEVTEHTDSCPACAAEVQRLSALDGMLRDALFQPAEIAEEAGRFDQLWEGIAAEIGDELSPSSAQPTPTPAPSFWQRARAWWAAQPRQAWVPAMAAAAVLLIMVALVVSRTGDSGSTDGGGPTAPTVARAPVSELPPFAGPRIVKPEAPMVAEPKTGPAPRRRAPEEMVASRNEAFIVDYEVDRGIVLIDQDPDEPDQPMVVWHLMPEDVEGNGDSI